jgi:hypothetical protein
MTTVTVFHGAADALPEVRLSAAMTPPLVSAPTIVRPRLCEGVQGVLRCETRIWRAEPSERRRPALHQLLIVPNRAYDF